MGALLFAPLVETEPGPPRCCGPCPQQSSHTRRPPRSEGRQTRFRPESPYDRHRPACVRPSWPPELQPGFSSPGPGSPTAEGSATPEHLCRKHPARAQTRTRALMPPAVRARAARADILPCSSVGRAYRRFHPRVLSHLVSSLVKGMLTREQTAGRQACDQRIRNRPPRLPALCRDSSSHRCPSRKDSVPADRSLQRAGPHGCLRQAPEKVR